MSLDGQSFLERAAGIVGADRVLTDEHDQVGYCEDWRGRYRGRAKAVILPGTTAEVSAIVRLCGQMGVGIVPQAGNTGLVGGAVSLDKNNIILNVSRMNRIRGIDPGNNSLVVEAGCILANVRSVAEQNGRQFPMLLGSVGSCEVGGLVSTNAGGTGVLRYGNMRDLVLGLEVVLPDGRVWNGLKSLRKDNSGYDLKHLFIGAEGTLGVITAASLKLFPRLTRSVTAMAALNGLNDAISLLHLVQGRLGGRVEAFELMSLSQIKIVLGHNDALRAPLPLATPWYVLVEIADNAATGDLAEEVESCLAAAMEEGIVADATLAADIAKAENIWALRHTISEANKRFGFTVSNDTSVPTSRIPDLIAAVERRLAAEVPAITICHVGHVGDGNVHVVVLLSRSHYTTPDACETGAAAVNLIVHEESVRLGGSISAEHGIGVMHVERLERFKPALDLEMMRTIKTAFDPEGLMNPGKIIRSDPALPSSPRWL